MKSYLVFLFLLLLSLNAFAHKPIDTSNPATRSDPIVIKDHQLSWVAYNKLERANDVDYYMLSSVKKGEKIYAEILIPKINRLKDFDPVIAVVGPGLKSDMDGLKNEIIEDKELLDIIKGEGVVIKRNDKKDEIFFEPFTQTRYWKKQKLEVVAPIDSDYFITIFDVGDKADKYVLSIGKKEKWGIRD